MRGAARGSSGRVFSHFQSNLQSLLLTYETGTLSWSDSPCLQGKQGTAFSHPRSVKRSQKCLMGYSKRFVNKEIMQTEPGGTKEAHFWCEECTECLGQECWSGMRRGLYILSDFSNPITRQILMAVKLIKSKSSKPRQHCELWSSGWQLSVTEIPGKREIL